MGTHRFLLGVFVLLLSSSSRNTADAANPDWWTDTNTRIISPTAAEDNYGPITLGQLKYVAKQAKKHLDAELSLQGGAGSEITTMVSEFEPRAGVTYTAEEAAEISRQNRTPVNVGQLKNVARPFYNRLVSVGYNTRANLILHGYPISWILPYPWDPQTSVETNYAPATLGQLKMVFSFSLTGFDTTEDSDGDTLPDDWEIAYGLDPETPDDPQEDPDEDGLTKWEEFLLGGDSNHADHPAVQLQVDVLVR